MPTHGRIFVVLLVMSCLMIVAQAQQGAIAGVVEANGQPLPGVLVGAQIKTTSTLGSPPAVASVRSDQNGIFRLTGLRPSRYILMILSPGWVTIGDARTGLAAREVEVKADETVENFKLSVVKGGVVTGRVTTQEGQPLIGISVNVTLVGQVGMGTVLTAMDRAVSLKYMTDDRGIYRVYGLQPGEYLVSVGGAGSGREPIPLTYYPTGSEKGKPVTVREEEETAGIDLTIRADKPTYLIQGRLVDTRTGQLVPGAPIRYTIQSSSGGSSSALATHSDAQGAFLIDHLERGKYTIVAGGDAQSGYYSEPLLVEVIDQDVTGLELRLSPSASISGTVVIEGESGGVTAEALGRLLLRARMADAKIGASGVPPIPIGPNGGFEVRGLGPGKVQLSLIGQEGSHGWWLTGIVHRGEIVTDGISLQVGDQVTGVQIRVTRGTGNIKGRVVLPENLLHSGIRIYVAAQPAERGWIRIANTEATLISNDGTFKIAGLLPGSYVLRLVARSAPEQVAKILSRVHETVVVTHNNETAAVLTVTLENK